MIVGRHLGNIERVRRFPAEFAQGNAVAYMHGTAALQIGQAEEMDQAAGAGVFVLREIAARAAAGRQRDADGDCREHDRSNSHPGPAQPRQFRG